MSKSLFLDIVREIRKRKVQFLTLWAIIVLGVALFIGLRVTGTDMRMTADVYFQDQKLSDIFLISPYGFKDSSVDYLTSKLGESADVAGEYFHDSVASSGDREVVLRVYSIPQGMQLDQIVLVSGRMPENDNEGLIDAQISDLWGFQLIDDTLVLDDEKAFSQTEIKIVGQVLSPLYINRGRGAGTLRGGIMNGFLYVPSTNFKSDAYSSIYINYRNLKYKSAFDISYDTSIDEKVKELKSWEEELSEIRLEEIKEILSTSIKDAEKEVENGENELAGAKEKYEEGLLEFENGQKEFEKSKTDLDSGRRNLDQRRIELANAEDEIAKKQEEIEQGEIELERKKEELNVGQETLRVAREELLTKRRDLSAAERSYNESAAEVDKRELDLRASRQALTDGLSRVTNLRTRQKESSDKVAALEEKIEELQKGSPEDQLEAAQLRNNDLRLAQYQVEMYAQQADQAETALGNVQEKRAAINEGLATIAEKKAELTIAYAPIEEGRAAIYRAESEVADSEEKIRTGQAQINEAQKTIDDGKTQIQNAQAQINSGRIALSQGERNITESQKKIEEAQAELTKAQAELDEAQEKIEEGEETLTTAQKDLRRVEYDLNELKAPELDAYRRNDVVVGYQEIQQDSDRIEAIGGVLPIIFFLVAGLVCLNTMSRMVEEQRTQGGVLKALGYPKSAVLLKCVLFAGFACVLGLAVGSLIGYYAIPLVIYNAYRTYYNTPNLIKLLDMNQFWIPALISFISSVGVAVFVGQVIARETPASLMRPLAPKPGKRILLEWIKPLWRKFSFLYKVTARNLFRSKARFWMSVLGIGGCTGLMITGFGMDTAIKTIVDMQFNHVTGYQVRYAVNLEYEDDKDDLYEAIEKETAIINELQAFNQVVYVSSENHEKSHKTTAVVPADVEKNKDFVHLRDRLTGEQYELTDDGAIINEKLGLLLDVKEGDTIRVVNEEKGIDVNIPILALTENYIQHYVYLTPAGYERYIGDLPGYNTLYAQIEGGMEEESRVTELLLKEHSVISAFQMSSIAEEAKEMMTSFSFVVGVVILAACLLAFVVMLNLNSMNISERIKELSTLKVLGFYDKETGSYIFRESVVLTFIGIVGGCGFGYFLSQYIVKTIEVDQVMFNRHLYWYSILFAIALTVFFAVFVNVLMLNKIKKVDMLEALKSVE